MNQNWKLWAITGLALSIGLSSAQAGEQIVRQFDGWTITITPKGARPNSTKSSPKSTKELEAASTPAERNDRRVLIRPISFEQPAAEQSVVLNDQPVPQAAAAPVPEAVAPAESAPALTEPVTNDIIPARETTVAPTLAPQPEALPPAPSGGSTAPCENCGLPVITPKRRDHDEVPPVVVPQTANYRDVYFSIPFIRAEYDANPSYRHDATMEFLFGQMRPTVIQRGTTNVNHFDRGGYGYGYDGYGWGWDPPYYPFSYGLRIHRSR